MLGRCLAPVRVISQNQRPDVKYTWLASEQFCTVRAPKWSLSGKSAAARGFWPYWTPCGETGIVILDRPDRRTRVGGEWLARFHRQEGCAMLVFTRRAGHRSASWSRFAYRDPGSFRSGGRIAELPPARKGGHPWRRECTRFDLRRRRSRFHPAGRPLYRYERLGLGPSRKGIDQPRAANVRTVSIGARDAKGCNVTSCRRHASRTAWCAGNLVGGSVRDSGGPRWLRGDCPHASGGVSELSGTGSGGRFV